MLFFRRGITWQHLLLLTAPLVVCGSMLWQRQSGLAAVNRRSEPGPSDPRLTGPPPGISSEEWQAAGVEFEGIADSTIRCSAEEMPAYWRLLKWSVMQPESDGARNDFRFVSFNELVNRPNQWRGRPVQVALNICRIMEYAAPENRLDIERLYEVWGWSEDSRGSLYVVVTSELPAGMSVGESVSERAIVSGYFYKVQGYLAAGSASQSSSAAPLVIGHLSHWTTPVAVFAQANELWFGGAGLLLAVSFVFLIGQSSVFRRVRRQAVRPKAAAKLESWVDSFGVDLAADGHG